jgi:hypothetical protein
MISLAVSAGLSTGGTIASKQDPEERRLRDRSFRPRSGFRCAGDQRRRLLKRVTGFRLFPVKE